MPAHAKSRPDSGESIGAVRIRRERDAVSVGGVGHEGVEGLGRKLTLNLRVEPGEASGL